MSSELFPDGVKPDSGDVIVALMGMTGAGKSSFISLCSDEKPSVGHELDSCTKSVGAYPFIYPGPPEKKVFLVDTPGFDDSARSDAEVLRELAAWLTNTYAKGIRLSGIIYLHRINQPRMQGSAKRNVLMFKELCGDSALKNVILATTMWDLVSEDEGARREKQLMEVKEFWGYMISNGSKVYRHENTRQSAMKLIDHFVKADSKITLEVQQEMVDQHKTLDGTAAAATLETRLEQERARFLAELRNVEAKLQEGLRKKDDDMTELLRELRADYQAELAQIKATQESLRTSMTQLHEERYAQLEKTMKEQQKAYETGLTAASNSKFAVRDFSKLQLLISDFWCLKIWDLATDRFVMTIELSIDDSINREIAWPSDRPRVVSSANVAPAGESCGPLKIWDLATGRCALTFELDYSFVMEWSQDGMWLATYSTSSKKVSKHQIEIWNIAAARCVQTFEHMDFAHLLRFSPNGKRIAFIRSQQIQVWDIATGRCVSTYKDKDTFWYAFALAELSWSPDGRRLVGLWPKKFVVWDLETGMADNFNCEGDAIASTAWSPDGTRLAVAGYPSRIWDPKLGISLLALESSRNIAWSPNGTQLALYGENNLRASIWDAATAKLIHELDYCAKVAWSHDGVWLVTGGKGKEAKVWDSASGQCVQTLKGFSAWRIALL